MRCVVCRKEINKFIKITEYERCTEIGEVFADRYVKLDLIAEILNNVKFYCPHCNAEYNITFDEAQDLLNNQAILVKQAALPKELPIIECKIFRCLVDKIMILRYNNKLYFSDFFFHKKFIRWKQIIFPMRYFEEKPPFFEIIKQRKCLNEQIIKSAPIINDDALFVFK